MVLRPFFFVSNMDKQQLRKWYEQKRNELSPGDVDSLSRDIVQQFSLLSLSGIRYLHLFYPIVGRHEFDSLLLVKKIRTQYPHISLVLPKSDLRKHTLRHILWQEETPLSMNAWGITEPEQGEEIAPALIDMVIIPLLAFDLKGNRLGYGKGFYDRFLSECRPGITKAGVSFFPPEESIEAEDHDIPLDLCITPEKIWSFGKG